MVKECQKWCHIWSKFNFKQKYFCTVVAVNSQKRVTVSGHCIAAWSKKKTNSVWIGRIKAATDLLKLVHYFWHLLWSANFFNWQMPVLRLSELFFEPCVSAIELYQSLFPTHLDHQTLRRFHRPPFNTFDIPTGLPLKIRSCIKVSGCFTVNRFPRWILD